MPWSGRQQKNILASFITGTRVGRTSELRQRSRRKHASSGVLRQRVAGGNEACFLIDVVQPLTQSLSRPHRWHPPVLMGVGVGGGTMHVVSTLHWNPLDQKVMCCYSIWSTDFWFHTRVCVCVCLLFFYRQCGKPSAAGAGTFGRFAPRAQSGDWKTPDSQLGGHPGSSWCSHRQGQRSVEAGRSYHKALFSPFIAEEPVQVWFQFCFQQ